MGTQTAKKREESSIRLQMRLCRDTLFLFVLLLLATSAFALDPQKSVTQFVHTSWTEKDGVPSGIWALAQTTDGYLWIGATTGLFRFDGLRFVRFEPQAGESLPGISITGLLATRDGALWVSSTKGAWCRLFNGHLSKPEDIPEAHSLAEAPNGTLVAGTEKGLWQLKDGIWKDVNKGWNFPGRPVKQLYFDKSGTLWVVTEDRVIYRPAGQSQFGESQDRAHGMNFAEAPDGTMWISELSRSAHSVPRMGERGPETEIRVSASWVLFDRNGSFWVASAGDGLRRVADPAKIKGHQVPQFGPEAEQFTAKDGLSGNYVVSMLEDREGNIWVGTLKGLDRFRESSFFPVAVEQPDVPRVLQATRDGSIVVASLNPLGVLRIGPQGNRDILARQELTSMCEDETGVIWVVRSSALRRYQQGRFVTFHLPDGIAPGSFSTLACDLAGGIWLYEWNQGLFRLANGALARVLDNPERAYRPGYLYADRVGRVWLGQSNRVWLYDHGKSQVFEKNDGIPAGMVVAFSMDRAGNVWAGGKSLSKFENGRFRSLSKSNGLPAQLIYNIAADDYGCLWLATDSGVLRVSIVELDRALADPAYLLRYESFDALDGLPGMPMGIALVGNHIARTLDGRIWFATTNGIAYVDPQRIPKNNLPPPVQVESLSASGRDYSPWNTVKLPARTTSLQIAYTAPSLMIPERVRFRYKLEGVENDWQEAGTRRITNYSNLGPGAYRFRVIACNNDGVWNNVGATLNFSILPAWYQTAWFRAFYIAAGMVTLYLLYLLRLRQVTQRMRGQIIARFQEREKIARDLHDTLLQGVQGLILKVDAAARQMPVHEPFRQSIAKALDYGDEILAEGRNRVRSLRGSTESLSDLPAAFRRVAEETPHDGALGFQVVVEGNMRELHPLVLEECFLIGREALINALRHSGGLHVDVEIAYHPKQFCLRISDDGRGIDPVVLQQGGRPDHWGLQGMQERAQTMGGQLRLLSRPEGGTEVELMMPGTTAYRSVSG
jgi:signal transduction histidine kinase/ligand-binding sensor domain-containing protein